MRAITIHLLLCITAVYAGSLKDVKHVVLFMQENRAFDHYFGTMAGVRGFADPNVQINPDGKNTFQQHIIANLSTEVNHLTPWYMNYLGGHWFNATQCGEAGSNAWVAMHEVWNKGLMNNWAISDTPWSWAHFRRNDIETHFDVAEGWAVGDMYQEAILAATDPNRIVWMSGTVNNPGTPSNPDGSGGMILDNSATPGCESPHLNCYPFTWKTFPEVLQDANVTWQVYQNRDNFADNMLAYFKQYQDVSHDPENPLTKFGNSYIGLERFYEDAKAGTLPMVSWIIGPEELSEHPPFLPTDGAWLINQVLDAITQGESHKDTVLLISYDEPGGYGDHVTPYHAEKGTPGEWIHDPYGFFGYTPLGPGFRMPFFIVSPWTRGKYVFTEHADHTSQIMFVEKWLEALGHNDVQLENITPWRREHMSDLVNAFDFDNPDYTIPTVASAPSPLRNWNRPHVTDGPIGGYPGNYMGSARCRAEHKDRRPPVPYGKENAEQDVSKLTEEGFKQVRGALTEGRYVTFETKGMALTNIEDQVRFTRATAAHAGIKQRWVLHQQGGGDSDVFTISSAADGKYIGPGACLTDAGSAEHFIISVIDNAKGYTIKAANHVYLGVSPRGKVQFFEKETVFSLFSVTYHS